MLTCTGCGFETLDSANPCDYPNLAAQPDCTDDTTTTTATTSAPDCTSTGGTCVEDAPDGFFGPNLYWIGPPAEKPDCPGVAPIPGSEAHADLAAVAHTCPTCECGPSETTCAPSMKWTVSAVKCPGDGAPLTSFDVLAPEWAGACNPDNPLPADAMCEGAPCAQSITVQAPTALGASCAVSLTGKEDKPGPPWPWGTVAQECLVTPTESCPNPEGRVCIPTPGDFIACISVEHGDHQGDIDCPPFYNDEKHVMYRDAEDTRTCSPCSCASPSGGECAITASVYADNACTDLMGTVVVFSDDGQACVDLPSGTALSSKSADVKLTAPGTCQPLGGNALGAVTPVRRVTLCCHHQVAP